MSDEVGKTRPPWDAKPSYSAPTPTRFYWLTWALFGLSIGIFEFFKARRFIHWRSALVCILVSFFLMQMLEGFATLKGLWTWNRNAVEGFIGNIPISEWIVYVMAPMVAVGTIEYVRFLLLKKDGKLPK